MAARLCRTGAGLADGDGAEGEGAVVGGKDGGGGAAEGDVGGAGSGAGGDGEKTLAGAGLRGSEGEDDGAGAPPGRVAAQLVASVKSPVRARVREKGAAPVLVMVTVWVVAEMPVTTTGVGEGDGAGRDGEVGVHGRAGDARGREGFAGDEDGEALVEQEGGGVGRGDCAAR